jgi:hypothetical protein
VGGRQAQGILLVGEMADLLQHDASSGRCKRAGSAATALALHTCALHMLQQTFASSLVFESSFAARPSMLQLCSGVLDLVHANYSWNEVQFSKTPVGRSMSGLHAALLTCHAVETHQEATPVDSLLWISCATCCVLFWCKL